MNYVDEFVKEGLVENILKKIRSAAIRDIKIMEVCGTHTMAIMKYGIKDLLPQNIKLISGPGCPVCVTSQGYIDTAIELSYEDNIIIATFGDMMKVPGTNSSLKIEKALGRDIRVVYSPIQSLEIAKQNPEKEIVFLGIGFETTAPIIALSIYKAKNENINNYFVLNSIKTMPNIIQKLIVNKNVNIDGFILPGHVASIIGHKPFCFIGKEYNIPAVITGFEPLDILYALYQVVRDVKYGKCKVENLYSKVVEYEGSRKAKEIINKVFIPSDSNWRGLGNIENTGLKIREGYKEFDAEKNFKIVIKEQLAQTQCICGDILKGVKDPLECKMFSKICSPSNPLGPCMVSLEGACAVYYKYGLRR